MKPFTIAFLRFEALFHRRLNCAHLTIKTFPTAKLVHIKLGNRIIVYDFITPKRNLINNNVFIILLTF